MKDIRFRYIKEVLFYATVRERQKHDAEKSVKVQKGCEKDTYKKGLDSFLEDSPKNKFQADCIWLTWKGFSNRGAAGVVSVRRDQELSPCLTKTVPADSEMDMLLAKDEPISNSGGTPVITYLRKGEKYWAAAV